jgi:hypothetical protein
MRKCHVVVSTSMWRLYNHMEGDVESVPYVASIQDVVGDVEGTVAVTLALRRHDDVAQ